ncbi:hypothetical protein BH23ACT3_BH23ACT3_18330 [soil metagenome]
MLAAGGALAFVGTFLPWVNLSGDSLSGFDDLLTSEGTVLEAPGLAAVVGGVIAVALGITLVAAGRILAVAIVGIVLSAIGLLVGLGFVVIAADVASWTSGSIGIGAILQPIGPALALTGSIIATAKRR